VKHIIVLFALSVVFATVGCQKESTDPHAQPYIDPVDTTVTERTNGTWNVPLTNFRYVWQNRRPTGWANSANYNANGPCGYPMYAGNYVFTEGGNTNLCGIASYMMGAHLVSHPAQMDVPYANSDRAIRLVEAACRYKAFDPYYTFGGYTYLNKIGIMGCGTTNPNKKGDFTNWSNCSQYYFPGTTWGGTTNRDVAKNFILSYIAAGKPCEALIKVNTSYGDANNPNYIVTGSGGAGHMVLITGLTINDNQGIYKIRFKDPWPNNSQTYEVSYTKFLDSMLAASSGGVYNVLGINGL